MEQLVESSGFLRGSSGGQSALVGGCYILNLKERVGTFSNGEPLKDFKHQKLWVNRALEILIWLQSV